MIPPVRVGSPSEGKPPFRVEPPPEAQSDSLAGLPGDADFMEAVVWRRLADNAAIDAQNASNSPSSQLRVADLDASGQVLVEDVNEDEEIRDNCSDDSSRKSVEHMDLDASDADDEFSDDE